MNTELYNENFEVLHKKFYPKWVSQVRSKIPTDYNISDNEIVSEITVRCLELAEKFKGGFFPSYCDLYVVCEVVKRMWNEYKKIDHSLIADAYDEFENGEDYTETPVVVAIDPSYTYVEDRKYKIRQLTSVYESAIRLDRETEGYYQYAAIVDDMRMGMSMRDIARDLNTNAMEISRRFATIKKEVTK